MPIINTIVTLILAFSSITFNVRALARDDYARAHYSTRIRTQKKIASQAAKRNRLQRCRSRQIARSTRDLQTMAS